MSLKWFTEYIDVEDRRLNGALLKLDNAIIALFWIGEKPRLGSVTVSLPSGTSSQLLGNRDEIIARMIGERLALISNKLVMVSTNFPVGFGSSKALFKLVDKLSGV